MLSNSFMKAFNFIAVFLLLFCACTHTNNHVTAEVRNLYESRGIVFDNDLKTCLILPEVGCGGCIDGAVYFLNENKEYYKKSQRHNMFVLTAVTSPKMALRTLNEVSLEQYYCVWDSTNHYLSEGNNAIYPLLLYLDNGKIVKAQYQSPFAEDVFETLEKIIKK